MQTNVLFHDVHCFNAAPFCPMGNFKESCCRICHSDTTGVNCCLRHFCFVVQGPAVRSAHRQSHTSVACPGSFPVGVHVSFADLWSTSMSHMTCSSLLCGDAVWATMSAVLWCLCKCVLHMALCAEGMQGIIFCFCSMQCCMIFCPHETGIWRNLCC